MMEKEIRKLFAEHPEILYGFTDISYCSYKESYRSALVFAVPYGEQLSPEDYTEERFEQGIQTARARLETVVAEIEQIPSKRLRPAPESDGLGKMMSLSPKDTVPGSGCLPF